MCEQAELGSALTLARLAELAQRHLDSWRWHEINKPLPLGSSSTCFHVVTRALDPIITALKSNLPAQRELAIQFERLKAPETFASSSGNDDDDDDDDDDFGATDAHSAEHNYHHCYYCHYYCYFPSRHEAPHSWPGGSLAPRRHRLVLCSPPANWSPSTRIWIWVSALLQLG